MKKSQKDIREIYMMLANICFPTITSVITGRTKQFLSHIELVINGEDFSYLIKLLRSNDLSLLEKKHDKLNIKLVEFTYALYEEWMEYIKDYVEGDFNFIFHLNKSYIEYTSDKFFSCILNDKIMSLYSELKEIEKHKIKIINAEIVEKYKDNVIIGQIKETENILERMNQVFKVITEHFREIDADKGLFIYIDDYKEYCDKLVYFINEFKFRINLCKEDYIRMCIEVFEKHIQKLYQKMKEENIYIDMFNLKLHILDFISKIIG